MTHFLRPLALAAALACASSAALAAGPSWIDWTSPSAGTITIGSTVVGVTLSGTVPIGMSYDDYYYNNGATGGTAPSGTYLGLMPHDMIQVNGPSFFTLTFSQAILNPYVALVSVGQPSVSVSYTFNGAISSMGAAGGNYWGPGSGSFSGNTFTGNEYNGVLQLSGAYSSLTVSTAPGEFWHGFNIGSGSVSAVPEPASFAMMLVGLGLMVSIARRRKGEFF